MKTTGLSPFGDTAGRGVQGLEQLLMGRSSQLSNVIGNDPYSHFFGGRLTPLSQLPEQSVGRDQ